MKPSARIALRLKNAFQFFNEYQIDALLVSSWPNATYLSGFTGTESWLFVHPKGLYFITDSRYSEQADQEAKGFEVILRDKKSLTEIILDLVGEHGVTRMGFESSIVTHAFYQALVKTLGEDKLKATHNLVERLRIKKDPEEIRLLKESADIAVKGFHYLKSIAQVGMKERELQARLEHYTKTLGSQKPAFDIIIAVGARASMPHAVTGETTVVKGQPILVDMGVVYEGYHSDLTRPIFLGKMTALQKKIYDIVWKAQRLGIQKAGPGVGVAEVDAACREHIAKKGYAKYFGHGTGHGVGLEVHEAPNVSGRSQTKLESGMVITVEPGIYLPGKIGIRIEDMVLITKNGNEVLTRDLDK